MEDGKCSYIKNWGGNSRLFISGMKVPLVKIFYLGVHQIPKPLICIAGITLGAGYTLRRLGRSSSDAERTKHCVAKAAYASQRSSRLQSLPGSVNLHSRCDEVPRVRKLLWQARLDHHALRIVMALLREPRTVGMYNTLRARPDLLFSGCLRF